MIWITLAEKLQSVWKTSKTRGREPKSKQWCDEQLGLNTDVLYFICALIGSRVKQEPKTKMKDLYLTCYTRLLEISANNFSALWLNSNYDLFLHYGNKLPDMVFTFLKHWVFSGDAKSLKLGNSEKIKVLIL
jgi:hypothetical protein